MLFRSIFGVFTSEDRPWRPSHTVYGKSSIKQSHLYNMRGRYFRDMSTVRADDGERTVPTLEENEVVIFRSFFKARLRFPLSNFVVEILKIYQVYLHQITPVAIIRMGIFVWAVRIQGLEPNAKSFCSMHGDSIGNDNDLFSLFFLSFQSIFCLSTFFYTNCFPQ